ncbi:MAG TPA: hypothetical protein VH703_00335 [Solirubrobacterales bacterium]|jgi:hypothetical protein
MTRKVRIAENPFVFDRPLEADDLVDREDELAVLAERLRDGVNTRLSSPRDYGKTSLLQRTIADARAGGAGAVLVDLYGIRTAGQMAAQIERAYEGLPAGPLRSAWLALRRRGGTVGLQSPFAGATLAVGAGEAGMRALLDALDLPHRLYEKTGQRMLVAFDEFQVVMKAELDGLIRSVIQHHGRGVTYVFSGSHLGMMRSLFVDRRRPFYGQAAPLELNRLPRPVLGDYIAERFRETQRNVGEPLGLLLDLVDGHPQRAMLFAHLLWRHTDEDGESGDEAWLAAHEEAWGYLQGDFEATWDSLSVAEAGVVDAVAAGVQSLTGKISREIFGLPSGSTAHEAATRLVDRGLLSRTGSGRSTVLTLVDPVFARWVVGGRRWAPG